MLNSKSFRNVRNVAPYNKPKTNITNRINNKRKVSIFGKFKSLINKSFHSMKSVNEGRKNVEPNSNSSDKDEPNNVNSPIDVPGGFFKESNTKPILVSSPQINENVSVKQKSEETSLVNLSNAKLADFFAHKGDKPLTEIELEGVMSLLRKSSVPQLSDHDKNDIFNSTFNSSFQDKNVNNNNNNSVRFHNDSNKIFNRSRILSTSSNFIDDNSINDDNVGNTTIKGLKVPQYVPNFDPLKNTTTTTTINGPNSRVSSVSSNKSSVRRVFNYSGMKSPYRNTVIFKYPSNYRSISASNNVQPQQAKSVTKLSPTKKVNEQRMTNVASALVTLLESNNNSGVNNNNKAGTKEKNDTLIFSQESKDLANPYSSVIRKPRQQNQSINLEKKNDLKSEIKQTIFEKTSTVLNTTTTDTTSNNKDNNNNNTSTVTSTNTYKPIKSSSLITNGVVAETVDQKDISEPKEKVKETKQTYIPQTSSFTFTFGKKNVNKEDTETKNNNTRTTLSPSDASITPSSTTDKDSSKLNTSTSTTFNVGKLEEKTNEYQYTFPTPTKSNIDPSTIDESKVNHFKSMFVF